MAAPMLSKGETKSTLGETVKQKQKKEIKKHKNVLFNPFAYKWPVIDKYFEGRILDELQSVLKSVPIKLPRRPASYFKGKKQTDNEQQLCDEEKNAENERRKLRSQIVCGVREVTRGLEKDDLDLIIVCRSTKPSLITKHLIPLAASRGCPALCIPEFNSKISPLLGVTSVVALGFKKVAAGSESSFHEFVTYSKSKAPPINTPWLNRSLEVNSFDGTDPTTLLESSADGGAGDTSAVTDDVSKDRSSRENSQCETDLVSLQDSLLTPVMSSGFISLESDSDRKLLEDSKNKSQAKNFADNLETGFLSLSPDSHNDPDEDASPSQSQLSFSSKEAGKSPTKTSADKEAGKSPTKNTAHKEAGKSPTKITAHKEAGKSPTKSTADKEAGKSPTKISAHKEGWKSPTKNTADKEGGKSPTKNTDDKEAGKGVRFVFPVDGPPPFVPKKDYSHLYVYKSGGSFGDNFIPLSGSKGHKRVLSPQRSTSESESADEEVLGILGMEQPVAKKPKHSSNVDKSGSYRPAVVRTMIPNLNKKRKRKR
ncbi:uncharacterized protein LOC125374135 [Haliotis rufescens]|uniref:uncharacterized protein LOC125374135 n=1 Tax=Haliotis rufescens TaxID=6454 RepID=UPI00201EC10B|nr:uncharacterized protein LOC125374135 [Haliotis rufescens]